MYWRIIIYLHAGINKTATLNLHWHKVTKYDDNILLIVDILYMNDEHENSFCQVKSR